MLTSSRRRTRLVATATSVAITAALLIPAGPAAADPVTDPVEQAIASALEARGIPGAQVVHRKGSTTESYAFGVQSTASDVPVTEDTMFQAASLSKVVGAYLTLKRVQEGKLDLDTPLWDYFESPRTAGNEQARTVTARMVLNHTTGFPNWAGDVNSEAPALVPSFEPGTRFGYSGDGFALLQATIEHIDGRPVAQSLQTEVFDAFGMTDTSLVYRAADEDRMIVGHDSAGNAAPNPSRWTKGNIAFTLHTSAEDYTTFLDRAVIDGEGLSTELHELWLTTSSDAVRDASNAANPFITWGLGIGLESNELGDAVWHWGDNGSRRAFFLAFPDRDESVAMFFNSVNGQRAAGDVLRQFYDDVTFSSLTWVGGVDGPADPTVPDADGWPELASTLQPIIDEATAAGVDLGVAVQDLSGFYDDQALFLGKLDRYTTASTIKMALAATVMQQVEAGALTLGQTVTITEAEKYGGSGVLQDRPFPQDVTVEEMLDLMVTVSDNTATNKLVDVVGGFGPINATISSAGIDRADLHFGRKMFGTVIAPDGDVWLSPFGVNQLMVRLYEAATVGSNEDVSAFLSPESAQHLIDLMLAQEVDTKLGAVIPDGVVAHKTGENDTVSHDIGMVLLPGQEVTLSVFSTRGANFTGDVQATAVPYLQRLGAAVYAYLLDTAPEEPAPVDPEPEQPSPTDPVPSAPAPLPDSGHSAPAQTPGSTPAPAPAGALPDTGISSSPGAAAAVGLTVVLLLAGGGILVAAGRRRAMR